MANIKGLKRVNRIINDFTRQFGVTAVLDTEFEAFCEDMRIGYTLYVDEDDQFFFLEDARCRYPEIKADTFLWLFMHELGHCITDGFWTPEEQEYFTNQKDSMMNVYDDQRRNDWYHACPDEFFATKWAGDYMMNHPKKIAKFWNELQAAILRMYRKNGVI